MSTAAAPVAVPSRMHTLTLRLKPGQDLRQQLLALTQAQQLRAGAVLTCVGSLTQVTLRLANQEGPTVYRGHFEIVSLVGTLATSGSHLHLSVADSRAAPSVGTYSMATSCTPPPSWCWVCWMT